MPNPTQMFEHYLRAEKGHSANMNALDYQGKLSADVTFAVPWGRVLHLDENGEFKTGLHATGMGLFAWPGSDSLNVSNPGSSNPNLFIHGAVSPGENMGTLVASGAYELASTEFDNEQTYVPGELLTAANDDTDADVGGVLTNVGSGAGGAVEQFVDPVCGVVSRGMQTSHEGMPMIHFWSVWLPGEFA